MSFELSSARQVLERTPDVLRAQLGGLGLDWIRATEGPETFSAFDVVGHLIDGEETDWMVRARLIRAQGPSVRFTPYDRFRHRERNAGRPLGALLDEFARLRLANLRELDGWHLTGAEMRLRGEHPTFGPVTLEQLLAAWVVHDLGHLAQVSRVLAKRFAGLVGPWTPFLPVLTDRPVPRS
jgi:hypothetical protein